MPNINDDGIITDIFSRVYIKHTNNENYPYEIYVINSFFIVKMGFYPSYSKARKRLLEFLDIVKGHGKLTISFPPSAIVKESQ